MRIRTIVRFAASLGALVAAGGCWSMRGSHGGGELPGPDRLRTESGGRHVSVEDVTLPAGYSAEVLARDLTFPVGVAFDDRNRLYVLESGYAYGEVFTVPRILRIEPGGVATEIAHGDTMPWTGFDWAGDGFVVADSNVRGDGGRILHVGLDGTSRVLVSGLPSQGDHHVNGAVMGPDRHVYFGIGVATNSGIVGEDSAKFGWLKRQPRFHDVPCRDVTLTGQNYGTHNLLASNPPDVLTGAFVPYGTKTEPGQVIRGEVPCTGSVLKVPLSGGKPQLVAWGFRNPFGLGFGPDGTLWVSDNGYDERGSRPIFGSGDWLWRVSTSGEPLWFGWPDFAGGWKVDDEQFKGADGTMAARLLRDHPNPAPKPVAQLGVHSSADGLDVSRSAEFGHVGNVFLAEFGDMSPGVGKVVAPVGFRVVRVDPGNGVTEEFFLNRGTKLGPATFLRSRGIERPVAVRFDRSGTKLVVADFGWMPMTAEGPQPRPGTGVIWAVARTGETVTKPAPAPGGSR